MTVNPQTLRDLGAFWTAQGGVNLGVVGNAAQRFWTKVVIPADRSECWTWTAQHSPDGYARFYPGRVGVPAYRFAYELLRGSVPVGLELDHLCRNRGCVHPFHLEAVSHQTNVLRGVSFAAQEAAVTHCPRGHEYDEHNTYFVRRPHRLPKRQCRPCKAINQRAYKARQRALVAA